jgi:hypothetical protein
MEPDEKIDFETPEMKEKIEQLKAKLDIPEEGVERQSYEEEKPIKGSEIDWSDYELDSNYEHFYPRAELKIIDETPTWIAQLDEFHTTSVAWNGKGVREDGTPKGVGEYITWMVNGVGGWKLVSVLPNGVGLAALIFQRKVSVSLPDPKLIDTEKPIVEPPKDEELKEIEDKALNWMVERIEGADFETPETT